MIDDRTVMFRSIYCWRSANKHLLRSGEKTMNRLHGPQAWESVSSRLMPLQVDLYVVLSEAVAVLTCSKSGMNI